MSASAAITEAKKKFAEFVNRAEYGGELILIKRRGKPIAAIIWNYWKCSGMKTIANCFGN